MAAGLLLGWVAWVNIFGGLVLGFAVGSAAFYASRRHRDAAIQGIAGGMALVAVLLAAVISSLGGVYGETGGVIRVLVNISYTDFVAPSLAAIVGAVVRFVL